MAGGVYIDTRLSFGLKSAPIIFTALADALEWIIKQQGVQILLHYLDDFITIGPPDSEECARSMQKFSELCGELGVPVAEEKTVGPATCLTFLGIEVDTEQLELRLLVEKLQRVKQSVKEWFGCKAARQRELESLLYRNNQYKPGLELVQRCTLRTD